MNFRNLLSLVVFGALCSLAPITASAQSYGTVGQNVQAPALPATPTYGSTTLSAACATPLTPLSCATTSVAVFSLAGGASGYGVQFNAVNGGTYQVETSVDCVNYIASNVEVGGTSPGALGFTSSISATGFYAGLAGTRPCLAVVATIAPTVSTTFYAYFGQHDAGTVIRGSVPLTATSGPGVSNFAPFQQSLTTTASLLVAARPGVPGTGRTSVTVVNSSGVTIYLGNSSSVTSATGLPIMSGYSATLQTTSAIYAISSSGTAAVGGYELY